MAKLTLLVLAAGIGSRYGGLKQIDPVGPEGELLLEYSIYDAARAGFDRVVVVLQREIEDQFRQRIGARLEHRIAVDYVFQELDRLDHEAPGFVVPAGRTRPWGTTHAVLTASDAIDTPFAAINADDFYGRPAFCALARHLETGSGDYALVGYTLAETLSDFGAVARGLVTSDDKGYLAEVVELKAIERSGEDAIYTDEQGERRTLPGRRQVSMNLWGFTPAVFAALRGYFRRFLEASAGNPHAECYLPTAINQLIQDGQARVRVLEGGDAWFGVTYREDRARVALSIQRLIENGDYPRKLWA
jgi:NDP-sugar pyrophosphorylase family protein